MGITNEWAGLTDEPGPEDGTDPKEWHKKPWEGAKAAGRKAKQLCGQAAEALHAAVGDCADPAVQALTVLLVTPAPHTGRLRVTLAAPPDVDRAAAEAALARAAGRLRAAVAAAISRRYAPELVFELV